MSNELLHDVIRSSGDIISHTTAKKLPKLDTLSGLQKEANLQKTSQLIGDLFNPPLYVKTMKAKAEKLTTRLTAKTIPKLVTLSGLEREANGEKALQDIAKIKGANNALKQGLPAGAEYILGRPLTSDELMNGRIGPMPNAGFSNKPATASLDDILKLMKQPKGPAWRQEVNKVLDGMQHTDEYYGDAEVEQLGTIPPGYGLNHNFNGPRNGEYLGNMFEDGIDGDVDEEQEEKNEPAEEKLPIVEEFIHNSARIPDGLRSALMNASRGKATNNDEKAIFRELVKVFGNSSLVGLPKAQRYNKLMEYYAEAPSAGHEEMKEGPQQIPQPPRVMPPHMIAVIAGITKHGAKAIKADRDAFNVEFEKYFGSYGASYKRKILLYEGLFKERPAFEDTKVKIEGKGFKPNKVGKMRNDMRDNAAFGRLALDRKELNNNRLSLQYGHNGHRLTAYPKTDISNNMKNAIVAIMASQEPDFDTLDADDKHFLKELIKTSGVEVSNLPKHMRKGSKKCKSIKECGTPKQKLMNKFKILTGEIQAGNNNDQIKHDLKKIAHSMRSKGYLTKEQYDGVLSEFC